MFTPRFREISDAPEEEALRKVLIAKLSTLKRTVHFKAYHPDRIARTGLSAEQAHVMSSWLEEVYSYILRRRLRDGHAAAAEEEQVVFELQH